VALMSGCGSDSNSTLTTITDTPAATTTDVTVADGYIVHGTVSAGDQNAQYTGADGKWRFSTKLSTDVNITVAGTSYVDIDGNGEYNSSIDKPLGFDMVAPGDSPYVTHLTTVALETGNTDLLEKVKNFDPVKSIEKITDPEIKTLLQLGEVAKVVLKYESDKVAAIFGDINVTNLADLNVTEKVESVNFDNINLVDTIKTKITVVDTFAQLAEKTDNIEALVNSYVQVSDGGETIGEATASNDINTTEIDPELASSIEIIDNEITIANDNLPTKLVVSTIKVGDKTVTLNGNSFAVTVDTTDKNITDYYNIAFPDVTIDKAFDLQTNVNVTVKIADKDVIGNEVSMIISGATIKPNNDNTSVVVELPAGASVTVTQTGLPSLQAIMGTSVTATTNTPLEMTDLAFNINTVLNAIDVNKDKITQALAELNNYLAKTRNYTVTIEFNGFDSTVIKADSTKFTGTVNVVNTSSAAQEVVDTTTDTTTSTTTECQNVNPITGACEDTTTSTTTDTTTSTTTECQNVNPITGACEDTI